MFIIKKGYFIFLLYFFAWNFEQKLAIAFYQNNTQYPNILESWECPLIGCKEQSDKNISLDVKLSAHSHLDAFWLQTFDEYFYGNGTDGVHRWVNVKSLYSGVIDALQRNENRTYAIAEISFFKRWWLLARSQEKQATRMLIQNGQLEFINGGWVQNDEGCAYYDDIIDQMMLGHQFLAEQFNIVPNIGFNIDNFGHSSSQAAFYSQMGFNAYIIARLTTQDITQKQQDKDLEFLWEPQIDTGVFKDSILTHIQYKRHAPWEFHVKSALKCVYFNQIYLFTPNRARVSEISASSQGVQSTTVFHYAGDDFQFFNQDRFLGMDRLIDYYSSNPCKGLNVTYSNFSDYFKTIRENFINKPELKNWKIKTQDFFPYQEDGLYWTGYFTSYPKFKYYVRESSRFLQGIRKLTLYLILNRPYFDFSVDISKLESSLLSLEQQVALAQHHDGISSTSKYRVHDDVQQRIMKAVQESHKIINAYMLNLLNQIFEKEMINESSTIKCQFTLGKEGNECWEKLRHSRSNVILMIYNPKPQFQELISFQIDENYNYTVIDENNNEQESQLVCQRSRLKRGCMFYFQTKLPAFGVKVLQFQFQEIFDSQEVQTFNLSPGNSSVYLEIDEIASLTIMKNYQDFLFRTCDSKDQIQDSKTGLTACQNKFSIAYKAYTAISTTSFSTWENHTFHANSGKYIMLNDPQTYETISKVEKVLSFSSPLISTFILIYERSNIVSQIRVLPWDIQRGLEIITHFNTTELTYFNKKDFILEVQSGTIKNGGNIFVDSNGFFMLKRTNYLREDFNPLYSQNDAASGNTFPMTSIAYIQDHDNNDDEIEKKMIVITDRPQGVLTLSQGQIQILIDRTAGEDGRGVGEALGKTDFQILKHLLLFKNKQSGVDYRIAQQMFQQRPIIFGSVSNQDGFSQMSQLGKIISPYLPFPKSLKLIARSYQNNSKILLRVQNTRDDDSLSDLTIIQDQGVTLIDILAQRTNQQTQKGSKNNKINKDYTFQQIEQYALNGARSLKDTIQNKWKWNRTDSDQVPIDWDPELKNNITLKPLQIRTFMISEFNITKVNKLKIQEVQPLKGKIDLEEVPQPLISSSSFSDKSTISIIKNPQNSQKLQLEDPGENISFLASTKASFEIQQEIPKKTSKVVEQEQEDEFGNVEKNLQFTGETDAEPIFINFRPKLKCRMKQKLELNKEGSNYTQNLNIHLLLISLLFITFLQS